MQVKFKRIFQLFSRISLKCFIKQNTNHCHQYQVVGMGLVGLGMGMGKGMGMALCILEKGKKRINVEKYYTLFKNYHSNRKDWYKLTISLATISFSLVSMLPMVSVSMVSFCMIFSMFSFMISFTVIPFAWAWARTGTLAISRFTIWFFDDDIIDGWFLVFVFVVPSSQESCSIDAI